MAERFPDGASGSRSYHRRIIAVYRHLIAPGQRVLELGCGRGDLLAAVSPAEGVGVDLSPKMIELARKRHPTLRFEVGDAHALTVAGPFDVVILSDLVNDLWDVQTVLERIRPLCHAGTKLIFNFFSRLWELPLGLTRGLGLASPLLQQNWLTVPDMINLLSLTGYETVRSWSEVLWPAWTPGIDFICNRYLAKLWPFRLFDLTNVLIARPAAAAPFPNRPTVSVIVPARNEAGNIPAIVQRIPDMGGGTEIVFIEGHSKDDTWAAIEKAAADNPGRRIKMFHQTGKGKGDAVRLGFKEATGDILMILDADMTVAPEDLPRFFEAVASGRAEFANGVRLVYPMEEQAMRFLNLLGNKFFSLAFTWLLGQSIKDTLCGTKVLSRKHYEQIAANRSYFGDFDPFGDFDLLFGAAKLNLKIVDVPIRYRQRTYGETNIQRFRHGLLLLRMTAFAARRIKFT